jgi:hypothetical protein
MKSPYLTAGSGLGIALALWAVPAQRASACSCAALAIGRATPADGSTHVPIDVAPLIEGYFDPTTVTWEKADGTPVEFELSHGLGHQGCQGSVGELVAKAPLEPNTTYVIRANGLDTVGYDTVFVTGDATVPKVALRAPEIMASFIEGNLIGSSCFGELRGCAHIDAEGDFELVLRDERDEVLVRTLMKGKTDTEIETLYEKPPTCVEVRQRDAAGRHSAVSRLCRDELVVRAARATDFTDYELNCKHGVIGVPDGHPDDSTPADGGLEDRGDTADDGSCSAAGELRGSTSWSLGLALLWLARRRRGRAA